MIGVRRFGEAGRFGRVPTPTGFPVGDINCYVILPEEPGGETVLVDCGVASDAAWDALQGGLKELGSAVEEISLVLLTHAHPDHFGQAARIADVAGCEVWGHQLVQAGIDRYALPRTPDTDAALASFLRHFGVPPERAAQAFGPPGGSTMVEHVTPRRLLDDGEQVTASGLVLDVIHTPGHCPDLVVYWHAESGTLLAGDHLLPGITPVCLLDIPATPEGERTRTLAQFHESLDKVEPLSVELLLPSHGDVLPTHRGLIAEYRLHTAARMLKVSRLMERAGGVVTPFSLARTMFPTVWDAQLHLVLSEVTGHLDLMERDGHVRTELREGVVHYHHVSRPPPA